MILDSRIKEGKRPLTCLDVDQAQQFVGKECIFSDNYDNYRNIRKYDIDNDFEYTGILSMSDQTNCGDYVFKNAKNKNRYRLILPSEWVKPEEPKKTYRAFTLAEWIDQHEIGEVIHYRSKLRETELRQMYVGTRQSSGIKKTIFKISLGEVSHTLDYLFEDYEIEVNGEWLPFGVIDE